ncbi:hypothetical protein KDM41_11815 [bacterium]|nr:hypothetical protein [bacterium]
MNSFFETAFFILIAAYGAAMVYAGVSQVAYNRLSPWLFRGGLQVFERQVGSHVLERAHAGGLDAEFVAVRELAADRVLIRATERYKGGSLRSPCPVLGTIAWTTTGVVVTGRIPAAPIVVAQLMVLIVLVAVVGGAQGGSITGGQAVLFVGGLAAFLGFIFVVSYLIESQRFRALIADIEAGGVRAGG